MRPLSREELATEAEIDVSRVEELVRVGVLRPAVDGAFTSADVQRVRIVAAYESAGIELRHIEEAIRRRWVSFEESNAFYPDPGERSSRTVESFVASLGTHGEQLGAVLAAFGLPTHTPGGRLTLEDERVLAGFLEAWDVSPDDAVPVRAARLAGETMRRTVEGWVELFTEQVTRPLEDESRTVDDLVPVIVPRARAILEGSPEVLVWLFRRHLEASLNAVNTTSMEAGLAREGLAPERSMRPPAIAFVDLAGFTRLTQEHGDELAAQSAARLAELSTHAAAAYSGRLVKLLGDGAMLHFVDPGAAVEAVLDLTASIRSVGLPPAHVGVAAGPVVGREGDFFGHTVNLAARLAARAGPHDVFVTRSVVDHAIGHDRLRFEPIGDLTLRNVSEPVAAFRARRDR